MKKIIFILAAFTTLSVAAQSPETIQKKLEKNDAAIADAKKGASPATWVERANLFFEMSSAYTNKIVQGITLEQAAPMIGKPTTSTEMTISGTQFIKNEFNDFDVYTSVENQLIQFWLSKKGDELADLNNSLTSLEKLKSLSEKDFKSKGIPLCTKLTDQFSQTGRSLYSLGEAAKAAQYFGGAAKSSELAGKVDTMIIYYAGIAYTEVKDYSKALAAFDKVLTYTDEDGMVYIYQSTCYEGLGDKDKAVKVLETGFEKNPNNANILSALINVYLKNEIDPQKLITIIQKAESLNPNDPSLFLVEGTVWDKLGDQVKAEAAFAKSIQLDNKNFNTYFNLGLIRARRGDELIAQANKLDLNDVKGYNKLVDEAMDIYGTAIQALETAHEINKTDMNTIEMLASLYFQKRDKSDEFAKRYEYFNSLKK